MKPYIGLLALLTVTAAQATQINDQRTASGGQKNGNTVTEGEVFPLLITAVWADGPGGNVSQDAKVNGQLLLDGNDTFWVTSTQFSNVPQPGWYHLIVPPAEKSLELQGLIAERDNWKRTAELNQTNVDFYRNLLVEIGEKFGAAAKTTDTGELVDEVLVMKIPGLVDQAIERARDNATTGLGEAGSIGGIASDKSEAPGGLPEIGSLDSAIAGAGEMAGNAASAGTGALPADLANVQEAPAADSAPAAEVAEPLNA